MRWEDIEGDWWTQPTNKADRVHRVYLAPSAREIVDHLGPKDSGLVFPNRKGNAHGDVPDHVKSAVRKASGIEDFRPHVLRHTATTEMSRIGVSKEHRSKVLNHSEGGITAQYGHYDFDREKKAALVKLEQAILGILGEDQKVIVFPG